MKNDELGHITKTIRCISNVYQKPTCDEQIIFKELVVGNYYRTYFIYKNSVRIWSKHSSGEGYSHPPYTHPQELFEDVDIKIEKEKHHFIDNKDFNV